MPRPPQRYAAHQHLFDATFPARVDALPAQRHEFAECLDALGVGEDLIEDLAVVYSELTTNAVHGSPGPTASVSVRAHRDGDDLVIEIRNATGLDSEDVRRWDLDDPLREGGRGLLIVRALVDDLDIGQDGRDLVVRCRCRAFAPGA